jgi:LacI family sucrose operon transcriptional repressor
MPNIKDVASLAGVSITTVSRVLNNTSYTSEATKNKVRDAMASLDYYPHQIARALSKKQSFLIGIILPDSSNMFFAELLKAIELESVNKGYKILLCNSLNEQKKEASYLQMLKENRADGIILCSHASAIASFEGNDRPIIAFDRAIRDIPYIASDNFQGGQLATRHLIDRGCKSLLHISGPLELKMLSNRRSDAFRLECIEAGISHRILESRNDQLTFAYHQTFVKESIRPLLREIDGVFCSNDLIAYAIYVECEELGIKVPEQLKIVGYDHSFLSQTLQEPKLTTIAQPIQLMGKLLCAGIIDIIERNPVHSQQLPVKLIQGTTT